MVNTAASLEGISIIDFPVAGADPSLQMVFLCRDIGDWNCLSPVIAQQFHARVRGVGIQPVIVAAGKTRELFDRKIRTYRDLGGHVAPIGFADLKPCVFVTSSSCSNTDLQVAARELFPDAPMVYVEDNYQQWARLFAALASRGLALPEASCCIDAGSRDDLLSAFCGGYRLDPDRVRVTGQPAFAKYLAEKTQDRIRAREELGFTKEEVLVAFMGGIDNVLLVRGFAAALAKRRCNEPVYMMRQHPRDESVPFVDYVEAFRKSGLTHHDTSGFDDTDLIGIAADIVVAAWSTELIAAAMRGIPAIQLVDRDFLGPGKVERSGLRFPLPLARAGAVAHCNSVDDAATIVMMLSSKTDPLGRLGLRGGMQAKQAEFRLSQGTGAARRILDLIESVPL